MAVVSECGIELTGGGGFLLELVKAVFEGERCTGMVEYLGYVKHDPVGCGSGNFGNGTMRETVATQMGPVVIDRWRDCEGTFTSLVGDAGWVGSRT